MVTTEINQIIEKKAFPGFSAEVRFIETHISWVILTTDFVYKIKKPLRYSFLDFSTLEKRKLYCERELKLNRRLTEDMYLAVVPIRKYEGQCMIEGSKGEVIDYAVKMKRVDESRQMDLLLKTGGVTHNHLEQLAESLAAFHACTEVVEAPPEIEKMQQDFADLSGVKDFFEKQLGKKTADQIQSIIFFSSQFLALHEDRILERHRKGFMIDGHGDLHSGNIFLLEKPIIFDCIEFNDHYRQVDVLDELAFFCMDLDFYGRQDLGEYFLECYLPKHPCLADETDRHLFQYYKLYRANVRMKVNALKAMQTTDQAEFKKRFGLAKNYYSLMNNYYSYFPAPINN